MKGLNDVRHLQAELTDAERRASNEKLARIRMLEILGDRYVLHRSNAPQKGVYNPTTGARLS
jgi:hypothetical protein